MTRLYFCERDGDSPDMDCRERVWRVDIDGHPGPLIGLGARTEHGQIVGLKFNDDGSGVYRTTHGHIGTFGTRSHSARIVNGLPVLVIHDGLVEREVPFEHPTEWKVTAPLAPAGPCEAT